MVRTTIRLRSRCSAVPAHAIAGVPVPRQGQKNKNRGGHGSHGMDVPLFDEPEAFRVRDVVIGPEGEERRLYHDVCEVGGLGRAMGHREGVRA